MKNYNRKVEYTCEMCGSTFMAWSTYKTKTCSPACKKAYMLQRLIDDYSSRVGMPIEQWLRQKYTDELWSYRDLIGALGVQHVNPVRKLLAHFNIPIRKGSEAVATQYVRNPERRELARQVFLANDLPPKEGGFNWAQQPGIGDKISEAKKGHAMYSRQSWYENICRSIQEREQQKEDTDIERAMQIALEEIGLPFDKQKAIGAYSVDFAIEHNGRKIAVECDGLYWHTLPGRPERDAQRDKIIAEQGWTVLRFTDKDINKDISYCVRLILAALDI